MTSPIRWDGLFARSRTRPVLIVVRSLPAWRGSRRLMTREQAAAISLPVLIAVGTKDEIAGSAEALGKIIPGAKVLNIPNRDHMRAVGDKVYKSGVLDFLSRLGAMGKSTDGGSRPA